MFGTGRRETTKMLDSKHPEYDHEKPDQSEIPLQSGTNKFASQKVLPHHLNQWLFFRE